MKKLFSLMLAVWIAVCALSFGASAAEDPVGDVWSTYTGTISEGNAAFTLKARGNEIIIELTSDYINGDELTCPGTKDSLLSLLFFGGSDGRSVSVEFADGPVNDGGNKLVFDIEHSCGVNAAPHTISLKNDVTFSIMYSSIEKGIFGPETESYNFLESGYSGKWGTEECSKLQLSVSGHTLTMSTTLPDQIGERDLQLNSDDLTVEGKYVWVYGSNLMTRIQAVIEFFRTLFPRFVALLQNVFGF